MTPYGNPPDWSALVDEHDQLTPEERRQHQRARVHEEDPELRVRTAPGATIATQPIPRHAPEPGAAQRGAQREECQHGVSYRYPCDVCDREQLPSSHATLEYAIQLAARAHAGQKDKAGQPYILHVMRVICRCVDVESQIVAALHDVVEDTGISLADLCADRFTDAVVTAVDALTRRPGEPYALYIVRLSSNSLARTVKLADLADNLDRSRILNPTDRDIARWIKYESALDVLRHS